MNVPMPKKKVELENPSMEVCVTDPAFYDMAYYASMDLRYLNNIHSGRFEAAEKILPLIRNKKTLDLGCGGGGLTNRYFSATKDLIGIDFSSDAIRFGNLRHPHLNMKQMDVYELGDNFKKGEFEVIIANDIVEHIYDPDAFMDNCKKVLSNNGLLIISTDLGDTPASRYKILKYFRYSLLVFGITGIKFLMLRFLEMPWNRLKNYHENHVKTYSRKDLLSLIEKHGFRVEHVYIYNLVGGRIRNFILNALRLVTGLELRDHQMIVSRKVKKT